MKIPAIAPGQAPAPAQEATVRTATTLLSQVVAASAQPVPSVRPVDAIAALRILVEEIRLAVIEQLGALRASLPEAPDDEPPAGAAARVLRFLRAATAEAAGAGRRTPQGLVERIVDTAAERALVLAGPERGALPGAALAVEEARQEILRILAAPPSPRQAAQPAPAQQVFVAEVRQALEERLGSLPAATQVTGEPEGPAEALDALARLFRAARADPVIAVRASNLALQQAVELGASRALSVAAAGPAPDAAGTLIADLRSLVLRELAAPVARTPPPLPVTDAAAVVRTLLVEIRHVLAERGVTTPVPADAGSDAEPLRALGAVVRQLSLGAGPWSAGDAPALRAGLEAILELAVRRSLLQVPATLPDRPQLEARLVVLRTQALQLIAAAQSRALPAPEDAGTGQGWVRPAMEAAVALLRGQDPPFRFDLPATRETPAARRRRTQAGSDSVEPIETTDPDDDEPETPAWPPPQD